MSFPRNQIFTDELEDLTEEERLFIAGNLKFDDLTKEELNFISRTSEPSDFTQEERNFISNKPELDDLTAEEREFISRAIPSNEYTEEEKEFIYGNNGNLHIPRLANKSQRAAILTAFKIAKAESLSKKQGSNPIELNDDDFIPDENHTNIDQQNIIQTYQNPVDQISINPQNIIQKYHDPIEMKHRHCNSFFNKLNHSKSHLKDLKSRIAVKTPSLYSGISGLDWFAYTTASTYPWKPYNFNEKKYAQYELKLVNTRNDEESRKVVKEMLVNEGCLWDLKGDPSGINSFNNIFLCSLRHTSIETYKQIVEEQYLRELRPSVKFQTGEINLYRGDRRDYKQILDKGFDLWPDANLDITPKINYASDHGQVGISTSKKTTTPKSFAGQFFKIHLPPNHHLLAIPFANTYQDEVNFMDNIPPEYIRSFVDSAGNERENPKYSPDVILSPKVRRGCY